MRFYDVCLSTEHTFIRSQQMYGFNVLSLKIDCITVTSIRFQNVCNGLSTISFVHPADNSLNNIDNIITDGGAKTQCNVTLIQGIFEILKTCGQITKIPWIFGTAQRTYMWKNECLLIVAGKAAKLERHLLVMEGQLQIKRGSSYKGYIYLLFTERPVTSTYIHTGCNRSTKYGQSETSEKVKNDYSSGDSLFVPDSPK